MNNWRAPGPSSATADEQPPVTVAERAAEAVRSGANYGGRPNMARRYYGVF